LPRGRESKFYFARANFFNAALGIWFSFVLILSYIDFCQGALAKTIVDNTAGPSKKNYKLGIKAFQHGDFDGAVDAELQAIYFARNGYQPDAYYQLGLAYQAKKDYAKAYEALSKSASQAMDGANEAHFSLAQVCTSLKKYQEATQEQAKALVGVRYGTPMWGKVKYQQAINLEEWGQIDAACGCYTECLGRWPWWNWQPWIHLGECLMKLKKWPEAYHTLEGLITTSTTVKGLDFERVYLDLGICDLAKGNHQGAMDNWHKVLEYNHDNAEAHLQLALLLDSEKHFSSAITEYKNFIRMTGEGDAERVKHADTRIALLEQLLGKQEPPPAPVAPSLYMRNQLKQRQQQLRQQQQPQPIGEPGF
jgi:tetratricopeptide (TPR) repeat protein